MEMSPQSWEAAAREALAAKAKPPGSLGRLEDLAATLCAIQETLDIQTRPVQFTLFVADNGVAKAGVTMWPQSVTTAVAQASLSGVSGCAVLARSVGAALEIVDVGLTSAARPVAAESWVSARVRDGSRDMSREPALTVDEFRAAFAVGRAAAARAIASGARILIAGEAGIGNTTASACLTTFLCGVDVELAVGAGAGATPAILDAKQNIARVAVARANAIATAGGKEEAVASVCGLEIAAMAGFYAEAATRRTPVVLDGAVCGAAALVAERMFPGSSRVMIAASLSPEPSHSICLKALDLDPYLDWQMRLGEGTGALLFAPLLDAAAAILREMAELQEFLR